MTGLVRTVRKGTPKELIGDYAVAKATEGVQSGVSKSLFPSPPEPGPTVPMPDETDVQRARRRSIALQQGRTGRASTILSDSGGSDRLGP